MKNIYKIFVLVLFLFFFLPSVNVSAQSALTLDCRNIYDGNTQRWEPCDDATYCEPETTFYEDHCYYAVNGQSECPIYTYTRGNWDEVLYCKNASSQDYCCEKVPASLVGEGEVVWGTDDISCPTNASRESSLISQANNSSLETALSNNDCEAIGSDDVNTLCDIEHYCIVNTAYYCCDYTPEGAPEELEVTAENTFVECSEQGLSAEETQACANCMGTRTDPTGAIWTELGCIDPSPAGLITRIFQIGLGVMGGIALLRTIQIAIAYQSDDPEQVKSAQEMLTSLVAGLILLAGGVVILQFVGVNILGIPREYLGG